MRIKQTNFRPHSLISAFTLIEVVMSASITGLTVAAIIYGYVNSITRMEWSNYSLAAQSLALQTIESIRAANWDPDARKDEVVNANFPLTNIVMDVPFKGTNKVWATNRVTITDLMTSNPYLKMIRVDVEWGFRNYSTKRVRGYTNTIVTYRRAN